MGVVVARTGLGKAWDEYTSALVAKEAADKRAEELLKAAQDAERASWDAGARLAEAQDALASLAREDAGLA